MCPFDINADGLVLGEGCGAVILGKQQNGLDPIYATVAGTGSCDTSSLLPIEFVDPAAMQDASLQALSCNHVESRSVAFAHLHGMANKACDVPEAIAMSNVFASGRSTLSPLVLAGHKGNFGHTESASGIVAIILSTMMLQKRQVPPNLGVTKPHPEFLTPEILLPITNAADIDYSARLVGAINGTAASGNNVSILLEHNLNGYSSDIPPSSDDSTPVVAPAVAPDSSPLETGVLGVQKKKYIHKKFSTLF